MSTRSAGGNIRARRGHKERSKNFTELEKRTVLELIARHRDVLRQGRSNNATNRSKQLVWSSICEEVNKRCGGDRPRTPAQVKMWYENYKKKCKMRAHDSHNHVPQPAGGEAGLLDGMLWQNIHPLELKDELDAPASDALSGNDDDCLPVNMSNGRISSANESDDAMASVLEPQVTITPHSPPPRAPAAHAPLLHAIDARIQQNLLSKLSDASNAPLNLSSLEETRRSRSPPDPRADCTPHTTHEERLYFTAKRQHAIWEHEAKMKILNMELRQKEEIFSLQKQLFLIELRLKMDFLEKASESAHNETE